MRIRGVIISDMYLLYITFKMNVIYKTKVYWNSMSEKCILHVAIENLNFHLPHPFLIDFWLMFKKMLFRILVFRC